MKLNYTICRLDSLKDPDREAMYQLMKENYQGTHREKFLKDLNEKTGVILLQTEERETRGFSTFLIYEDQDIKGTIIYSGDTIIHRDNWGSPLLFYGFGEKIRELMENPKPGCTPYWFLISKGFRTYYMLPLFFREYWPQAGKDSNDQLKEKLDILCRKKFGSLYDKNRGILQIEEDCLTDELAQIPPHRQRDPHIQLFLERNPGYIRGNELACLTELSMENIHPAARRFVQGK